MVALPEKLLLHTDVLELLTYLEDLTFIRALTFSNAYFVRGFCDLNITDLSSYSLESEDEQEF